MIAMGIIIALLGAALFIAERIARHFRALNQVSLKDAILVGCAQALAIFPGVSRSGATITAGLALGFEREAAARFSFLLSAPIIAGAGAKSMLNVFGELRHGAMSSAELIALRGWVSRGGNQRLPVHQILVALFATQLD